MAEAAAKQPEELIGNRVDLYRSEEKELTPAPVTPLEMLNRALIQGADINLLEKLMALQERWEANQAKKAFDEALAAAKAEITPIARNATGHNNKKYADFSAIAEVVDPILGKNGLSYRFRTTQTDKITVTCILSHREGHAEETTLSGPADKTGNKNDIQAIGSTLTYLQRYSLVQMLGLAAATDDDGARGGNGEAISDDQLVELREAMIKAHADNDKFCEFYRIETLSDLPASKFKDAMARIAKKARAAQ